MGEVNVPCAHTAAATVTSSPLSTELTSPTCFTPFTAITLFGFNTVVTPVSSMFQILDGRKGWREKTSPNFWKNSPTLFKLNAAILPKLVLSGCLIERFFFSFITATVSSQIKHTGLLLKSTKKYCNVHFS